MHELTSLPFDDVIIYDSLLESFPVSFGAGARRMYKASYDDAKARGAVLRRLPAAEAPTGTVRAQPAAVPAPAPKKRAPRERLTRS